GLAVAADGVGVAAEARVHGDVAHKDGDDREDEDQERYALHVVGRARLEDAVHDEDVAPEDYGEDGGADELPGEAGQRDAVLLLARPRLEDEEDQGDRHYGGDHVTGDGRDVTLRDELIGVVRGDEDGLSLGDDEDARLPDIVAAEGDDEWGEGEEGD